MCRGQRRPESPGHRDTSLASSFLLRPAECVQRPGEELTRRLHDIFHQPGKEGAYYQIVFDFRKKIVTANFGKPKLGEKYSSMEVLMNF